MNAAPISAVPDMPSATSRASDGGDGETGGDDRRGALRECAQSAR